MINKNDSLLFSGDKLAVIMESVLKKNADFRFKAKGFSMSPFIKNGDLIQISPAIGKSFLIGDVVAVKNRFNGSIFVHRIVFKNNSRYLIKGDNLNKPDGFFDHFDILGIVTYVERNKSTVWFGKKVIAFLSLLRILNFIILPLLRFFKKFFLGLIRRVKRI